VSLYKIITEAISPRLEDEKINLTTPYTSTAGRFLHFKSRLDYAKFTKVIDREKTMSLTKLSDRIILNNTKNLVIKEKKLTANIIDHLQEIERRKL